MNKVVLQKLLPLGLIAVALSPIGFVFQNCARSSFGEAKSTLNKQNLQNCTDTVCDDVDNGVASCSFNGATIPHDGTVKAYLTSSVASSASCEGQTRTCQNGVLSGSYAYSECSVDAPRSCLFDGKTVAHGSWVTAFLTGTVAIGEACQEQARVCHDGTLSGTYAYGSCATAAPASCLFNGQTIASGSGVFAFGQSSVPAGQVCSPEFRLCFNGMLSGTANYASCQPEQAASCLFNGQTIVSGDTVVAYQNSAVPAGQSCQAETRLCKNGALSGSFNFGSCAVQNPSSCLFDGLTIPSSGSVVAYLTSSVPAGQACQMQSRSCVNGVLSGSYSFSSCVVDQPASCLFNGKTIAHGQSVVAFEASTVGFGSLCNSQQRTCENGVMSGAFTYGSCSVDGPAVCRFNDRDVAHGEQVVAFQSATVTEGQNCQQEARVCQNGRLSGSYSAVSCTSEARSCLFNGNRIAHGSSFQAYFVSSVANGQTCTAQSEMRTCTDGVLSGSAAYSACEVRGTSSCVFNGTTLNHGASVTAYLQPTVPTGQSCVSETRVCTDGSLSGSYLYRGCHSGKPQSCLWNGTTVADGGSIKAYTQNEVAAGQSCESVAETRTCTNGVLSGTGTFKVCKVKTPASCTFNGQTIAHGAHVRAFKSERAPAGSVCEFELRTCDNGTLSGQNQFSSCLGVAVGPNDCSFRGTLVADGTSVTAYQRALVPMGKTCLSEKRVCTKGVLSGSFPAKTCDVASPVDQCKIVDGERNFVEKWPKITTPAAAADCKSSVEIWNVWNGATIVINHIPNRQSFISNQVIELDYASYLEPDDLEIRAFNVKGDSTVLFRQCRISTGPLVENEYMKTPFTRPADESIRDFRIVIPTGTSRLQIKPLKSESPFYIRMKGLCNFDIHNPQAPLVKDIEKRYKAR